MNIIKFYKVNEPYGFFSNFAPYPVFIDNELWKTTEHYFQASKFEDERIKSKIKEIDSPMQAAIEGRNRSNILRSDWGNIKDEIMWKALLNKFSQHPTLRKELILTKNSKLVEHTKNDSYWADGGDGSGKNMLGFLLEKVRTEMKKYSEDPDLVLPPWIAFPSIEQDDLFWRMGLGEEYLFQWAKFYNMCNKNEYRLIFPETQKWEGIYD